MNTVGSMNMPEDFRYRDVFLKGKPRHDRYDRFRILHPKMEIGHRAKIFAPFDALRGFSAALLAKDVQYEDRRQQEAQDREETGRRLNILRALTYSRRAARENRVTVSVTYFEPCRDEDSDAYEVRGQYLTVTGICWGVDFETLSEIRIDKTRISLEEILRIESADGLF